jgi:uncharacterized protein YqhQ
MNNMRIFIYKEIISIFAANSIGINESKFCKVKENEKKKVKKNEKKSKLVLFWESRRGMEPGFEIVDMRAILK